MTAWMASAIFIPLPSLLAVSGETLGHYVLWGCLALLLLSPAILSRTRWSESRPLVICVALSVVAHVLLMIYAYATRLPYAELLRPGDGEGGETIVSLSLLDDEFPSDEESSADDSREASLPADESPRSANSEIQTLLDTANDPANPAPDAQSSSLPPENSASAASESETPADSSANASDLARSDQQSLEEARRLPMEAAAELPPVPDMPTIVAPPAPAALPLAIAAIVPEASPLSERAASATGVGQTPASEGATTAMGERIEAVPADVNAREHWVSTGGMVSSAIGAPANAGPVRPADGRVVPTPYRNRQLTRRLEIAQQHGGNVDTEAAVRDALDWLAAQQSSDGRWSAAAFGAGRESRALGQDRGGTGAHADTGLTGLALLAFLGAGETHFAGPHREHIQHGLEFLLKSQRTDGELAGSADLFARMYCHGMATLALSEASAMTGDDRIRPYLERAIGFTVRAQDPVTGGWRYRPGDSGDTSQFGWQLMALKSAQQAGVTIPPQTWLLARRFVESVTSGTNRGLASYRPGERPSRTMTAEALVCRILLDDVREPQVAEALSFVMQEPPRSQSENHYYWYYGTLAMFQTQGQGWPIWNDALQRQLLAKQRKDGANRGSWDPDPVWGAHGGRVFSTSMGALCLEVYYRYLPLYKSVRVETASPRSVDPLSPERR